MFRRFSTNFAILSIVLDMVMVGLSLIVANYLRPLLNALPFAAEIQKPNVPILLYPIFSVTWVCIFLLHSVYDGRRNLHIYNEITSISIASSIAAVSLAGMLYLSFREVSRILFLVFVVNAYTFLLSWRLIARLLFRLKTVPIQTRNVLIVGAGPVGQELDEKIKLHPYLGLNVVGFLDDDTEKLKPNPGILGPISHARRVVHQQKVDDVVIALPRRAYRQVNQLVAELHTLPVRVWVIPDYFHLALHKAAIDEFAGIPMLDLRAPALNEYQRMVKRMLDLILTSLFLIPALPLMALIAILIRLDSPGPIIYKQDRAGENGKLFQMYKFRSMVDGAEGQLKDVLQKTQDGKIIHKTEADPRITRFGRFLRRTSLDELPQLFNVLRGDMSLVGPRPELPLLVAQYEPWQHKRFAVPQGITGWWQVNGRSSKPMHLNTEDDLYYIHHYSILLDLEIILKTIWVVLRGKGAY